MAAFSAEKLKHFKRELALLGKDYKEVARIAIHGKKKKISLAGRKIAPKYRDPKSKVTWAGRGAQPVWMRDALKSGKKAEDFLIDKLVKKTAAKKVGKKKQWEGQSGKCRAAKANNNCPPPQGRDPKPASER